MLTSCIVPCVVVSVLTHTTIPSYASYLYSHSPTELGRGCYVTEGRDLSATVPTANHFQNERRLYMKILECQLYLG
jgi:hypothetical protein